jgi:tetratricopeptide (TPR) repeat protein
MGIVYRKEGDYNKALICYTQALQIEQTTLSSDNLDLADTYNNLCTLYYDKYEFDKALEMARSKLNILKRNFDDNNEQVKTAQQMIDDIIEVMKEPSNIKEEEENYSLEICF